MVKSLAVRHQVGFFLREYRPQTVIAALLLFLSGLFEGFGVITLLPLFELLGPSGAESASAISRGVADALAWAGVAPTLGLLLGLFVTGMWCKGILLFVAQRYAGRVAAGIAYDLRLRGIHLMQEASWPFFVRQKSGELLAALGEEPRNAAGTFNILCRIFVQLLQALIYLGIAVTLSFSVTLLTIVAAGVMVYFFRSFVHITAEASSRHLLSMRRLVGRIQDLLNTMKPIKAMAAEARMADLLKEEVKELRSAQYRTNFSDAVFAGFQEPTLALILAVCAFFAIGVWGMPVSQFLFIGFALYRGASRISAVQGAYQGLAQKSQFLLHLERTLAKVERAGEHSPGKGEAEFRHEIRFRDAHFAYGEKRILDGAELEIPRRGITAISGPSGAGKTTVTDLMVGLQRLDRGVVEIDGRPLEEIDIKRWRGLVGYVPQEPILFHDTILANVTLNDPGLSREDAEQALRGAGAWEFIQGLEGGLDAMAGERGVSISGGQRQRVALARALVRKPSLLILDEATTGLDRATEAGIIETLLQLAEELAVVVISHQPGLVEAAHRLYRLEGGKISLLRG